MTVFEGECTCVLFCNCLSRNAWGNVTSVVLHLKSIWEEGAEALSRAGLSGEERFLLFLTSQQHRLVFDQKENGTDKTLLIIDYFW